MLNLTFPPEAIDRRCPYSTRLRRDLLPRRGLALRTTPAALPAWSLRTKSIHDGVGGVTNDELVVPGQPMDRREG